MAPEGAPSVVYIVLDDVGFSAMSCYGGPIETPNIDRIAADGIRYTQWHTTALCSPTRSCLLTGRNHTRNSMACITEAAIGFPNASGTIARENGMLPEILGERGWNTYVVGKWHLCPTIEMNVASTRRNWPTGRGFERFYAPDGQMRTGRVIIPGGAAAGSTVMIWTDQTGQLTDSPLQHSQVTGRMYLSEALAAMLITVGAVARWALDRRRLAAWDAEWLSAGPRWSPRR